MKYKVIVNHECVPHAEVYGDTEEEALAKMQSRLKEVFEQIGVHPTKMKKILAEVMATAKIKIIEK